MSLESGWETVEEFVDALEAAVEKEKTEFREADWPIPPYRNELVLVKTEKSRRRDRERATIDKTGRIFLSPEGVGKRVAEISFDSGESWRKVKSIENLYNDDKVVYIVCRLLEES